MRTRITYPDGRVVTSEDHLKYGLVIDGLRPVLIEYWGVVADEKVLTLAQMSLHRNPALDPQVVLRAGDNR